MSSASKRRAIGLEGVSNMRRFFRRLEKEVKTGMTKEIQDTITEAAELTVATMKSLAPRDNGDLNRSITYVKSSDGLTAVVGPGIRGATTVKKKTGTYGNTKIKFSKRTEFDRFQSYKAYWLEMGTKKMGRRPFIKPTADLVKERIVKMVDESVSRFLKRLRGKGINA